MKYLYVFLQINRKRSNQKANNTRRCGNSRLKEARKMSHEIDVRSIWKIYIVYIPVHTAPSKISRAHTHIISSVLFIFTWSESLRTGMPSKLHRKSQRERKRKAENVWACVFVWERDKIKTFVCHFGQIVIFIAWYRECVPPSSALPSHFVCACIYIGRWYDCCCCLLSTSTSMATASSSSSTCLPAGYMVPGIIIMHIRWTVPENFK